MLEEYATETPNLTSWQRARGATKPAYTKKKTVTRTAIILEMYWQGGWNYTEICQHLELTSHIVMGAIETDRKRRRKRAYDKEKKESEQFIQWLSIGFITLLPVAYLAFWGTIIYVAWHFISKLW